jgi:hypothetical protein
MHIPTNRDRLWPCETTGGQFSFSRGEKAGMRAVVSLWHRHKLSASEMQVPLPLLPPRLKLNEISNHRSDALAVWQPV